jgi:aspartate dehydrogenase
MSKPLRIGIVGCGAIGGSLAKIILSEFKDKARLVGLYDVNKEKAQRLVERFKNYRLMAWDLKELIKNSDFLIEATHKNAVFAIAKDTILAKKNIMIMSVGGLLEHYQKLKMLAEKNRVNIFVPSGAVCGIDGLKASVFGNIKKVTLITKKPPIAFEGSAYLLKKKIKLENIKEETVLFEGNALSAVNSFPQNINVSATLSLAGIGAKRTVVRIVALPNTTRNIHEIEIESDAGRIFTRTENVAHPDNPKTSYLAVLSAAATLKQILGPIKIGT